ncbi:nucleotide-diphospho-sugar transferase [Infundibulicybe gibba]|nr:nucleotide-diphospho-sugar transferase [Infundibulicybe gibba]
MGESTFDQPNGSAVAETRPNAVIAMLVSPTRMTQALMALKNVEDRFNRRLKYPYVLLTEAEISPELQDKISWATEGRATVANLPAEMWDVPEWLDRRKIQESLDIIGYSLGYRSMCRFYSGFFWKHPALSKYDWIWRLDTDIEFHCDIPYDPVQIMIDENKLYGFVQITGDAIGVQPTLAPNASTFLRGASHLLPADANLGFIWRDVPKALQGEAGNNDWTIRTMYDNFEISHRSVWESPIYQAFFDYLDNQGGFFYERWSDAPIHSFGLAMTLRKDQVIQFTDTGYQHQGWGYECPDLARCACVKDSASEGFRDNADWWFEAP